MYLECMPSAYIMHYLLCIFTSVPTFASTCLPVSSHYGTMHGQSEYSIHIWRQLIAVLGEYEGSFPSFWCYEKEQRYAYLLRTMFVTSCTADIGVNKRWNNLIRLKSRQDCCIQLAIIDLCLPKDFVFGEAFVWCQSKWPRYKWEALYHRFLASWPNTTTNSFHSCVINQNHFLAAAVGLFRACSLIQRWWSSGWQQRSI